MRYLKTVALIVMRRLNFEFALRPRLVIDFGVGGANHSQLLGNCAEPERRNQAPAVAPSLSWIHGFVDASSPFQLNST